MVECIAESSLNFEVFTHEPVLGKRENSALQGEH